MLGLFSGTGILLGAQQTQLTPPEAYLQLGSSVETRLRHVTELVVPQGPALRINVYDWIIGPRQEIAKFPLEGFATIEVKAGEVETTIGGTTVRRHEGEFFVVPEGDSLSLRVRPETARGDNLVSLRGVVVNRR